MIRITLLYMVVLFFSGYAFKDWYKSLCVLIALMAVVEHPDMPKTILGIQGLNLWNLLLIFVVMGFLGQKGQEKLKWDMPKFLTLLLWCYLGFVLVGFFRLVDDLSVVNSYHLFLEWEALTTKDVISEYLINTLKFMVPAVLVYYGCNSEERMRLTMASIVAVYFLIALQVIKAMPVMAIAGGGGDKLTRLSLKIMNKEVGFHRVDVSMMLAGGSWALFSTRMLMPTKTKALFIWFASFIAFFGQALTGGRTGYGTWGVIGLVMGIVKWRKLLVLGPIFLIVVVMLIPATRDRMMQGFTEDSVDTNKQLEEEGIDASQEGQPNWYTITAGRSVAWPFVFDKIEESPWWGHGREAMQNTGISEYLWEYLRESFPHPHNAYLQWTLDNGYIALAVVLFFYLYAIKASLSIFRDKRSDYFTAVGGIAFSLIAAQLIASVGSQSFYPRESAVTMLCAMFLMLRLFAQRKKMNKQFPDTRTKQEVDERLWLN
ncbi:MAG: O-antigen ligase family protein [gamma proteobacterium endosymbiont of Lamellibrachia anaximandri]|nr:O-antigen ligase family protein [gamma proteobacterium endosymbiont of Lamellibrachia anaximandri]MBL3617482.1 O-antigen ligase family protein [gamma proteobacterium endosymbiont of Lamellibrachia anaximandri]